MPQGRAHPDPRLRARAVRRGEGALPPGARRLPPEGGAGVSRLSPFDLVFGELAEERFPALRTSLAAGGTDATDRDAFVLDRAVTEFLRELVPDDAPAESLHEFIALLQHGYLFWAS